MDKDTKFDKPFFILAPMEAVTDTVFRQVIKKAGAPDLWYTEFTNATGWVHAGQKAVGGRLYKEDFEKPIIAQIWGGEAGDMEALAHHCKDLGYDGIDINMGCPAKSAIKSGGASLIRKPEVAIEAIKSAKKAGLPISVKTRLGYSSVDEWKIWLTTLLEQDIVRLTVHLRTKKEMSKVPAHWELMSDIVKLRDKIAPQTQIVGNGDVRDKKHGMELIKKTGVDGVMIGRGIFANPFAFCDDKYGTKEELLELLRYHIQLFEDYEDKMHRPYETLKRFFKIYIRDFDGAKEMRAELMETKNTNQAKKVIQKHH